jgi:hypothetical protein
MLAVAPIAAPTQHKFVAAATIAVAPKSERVCFYFPFCQKFAKDCGGVKKGGCRDVKADGVQIPTDNMKFLDQKKKLQCVKDAR